MQRHFDMLQESIGWHSIPVGLACEGKEVLRTPVPAAMADLVVDTCQTGACNMSKQTMIKRTTPVLSICHIICCIQQYYVQIKRHHVSRCTKSRALQHMPQADISTAIRSLHLDDPHACIRCSIVKFTSFSLMFWSAHHVSVHARLSQPRSIAFCIDNQSRKMKSYGHQGLQKCAATMEGRKRIPHSHMKEVLFVEVGTGCDQHGQNVTKAAVRACRNAIEFNSIPSIDRLVPGGYEKLLLHVKIAIPHPVRQTIPWYPSHVMSASWK